MVETGIDQLTVILQPRQDYFLGYDEEWYRKALTIMDSFAENALLEDIFGNQREQEYHPVRYPISFGFGEHDFKFALAYNANRSDMGVICQFSATALEYYEEKTKLRVYKMIQRWANSDCYTLRFSRLDVAVDYFDFPVDLTALYHGLNDKTVGVFQRYLHKNTGKMDCKRVNLSVSGYAQGAEIPTIYVGSKKSPMFLRVYDKRMEQIAKKGRNIEKAIQSESWIRFEAEIKDVYAHQMTEDLLSIRTDKEYKEMLLSVLLQKYSFMRMDKGVLLGETDFTAELSAAVKMNRLVLRTPKTRDYHIARMMVYLMKNSGLTSTLFKIMRIWDAGAVWQAFDQFFGYLMHTYVPNADCLKWIESNRNDYLDNFPDFKAFCEHNEKVLDGDV